MQSRQNTDSSGLSSSEENLRLAKKLARQLFEFHSGGKKSSKTIADSGGWDDLSGESRETFLAQARAILANLSDSGWRSEVSPDEVESSAPSRTEEQEGLLKRIRQAKDLASLNSLWRAHDRALWSECIELYRQLGGRLLKLGEPLLAFDVLADGLKVFPADVTLRRQMALSLARSGAPEKAEVILEALIGETEPDEETLGLKARIHKDLWQLARDNGERQRQLQLAYAAYNDAFRLTGGYWTGINAATMALILGEREAAFELASQVRRLCLEELERLGSERGGYWALATLGEASLILGDWDQAEDWYSRAVEASAGRLGDLASTRRNARLLLKYLEIDSSRIERCFRVPPVVVFTGHMIDQPGRARPRFPAALEEEVRRHLERYFSRSESRIVYSSAACGSDILFLETAVAVDGSELHIVLPFPGEEFVKNSVDIIPGADWADRYERVCASASEMVVASAGKIRGAGLAYEYANLLLLGLANIRAQQLETDVVLLTVWDGLPGDGPGGTSSMVGHCRELGFAVEWIDLSSILRGEDGFTGRHSSPQLLEATPAATFEEESSTQIKAMLFGDVVNSTKILDEEIPSFVDGFLNRVADLISRSEHAPSLRNTWGDGLFFVFETVRDAGLFALELEEMIRHTDWREMKLRTDLNLRIGLHVGPVYQLMDGVAGRETCFGTHVSRAARIEPIAPPGKVYASQAFAALAATDPSPGFRCAYVGQTPLAKGFGTFPTYHIHR